MIGLLDVMPRVLCEGGSKDDQEIASFMKALAPTGLCRYDQGRTAPSSWFDR
jgi:hypothetical protein